MGRPRGRAELAPTQNASVAQRPLSDVAALLEEPQGWKANPALRDYGRRM